MGFQENRYKESKRKIVPRKTLPTDTENVLDYLMSTVRKPPKTTIKRNNVKSKFVTKGKKPIGSQSESKVEPTATTSKLDTTSSVSNGSTTTTSSFKRNMNILSPPFNSRYVHPPSTNTWGTGWGNTYDPSKGEGITQEKFINKIFLG